MLGASLIFWFLRILAHLGIAGAVVGLFLGLFQNFHPALDSFSHFRLHLVVAMVVCSVVLVVVSMRRARAFAVFLALIGMGWLAFEFNKGPPELGERGALRLAQFNLNFRNRLMDEVGHMFTESDADVVALQEVLPSHEKALRGLSAYPHQAHCRFRRFVGGVSILSKHPLSGIECADGEGLVTALVDLPGGAVTVGSIHTFWPWPYNQHAQVDRWLPKLESLIGPVILAGDFNAAPWSHAVSKVEKASRTTVVPGVRMTIGVKVFPLVPAVPIPIDHALLSEELCATSVRVGETTFSDHFPVFYEIDRGCADR